MSPMRAIDQKHRPFPSSASKSHVQLAEAPPAPNRTNEKQIGAPLNSSDLKPTELGQQRPFATAVAAKSSKMPWGLEGF